ncbi:methionyl-tRNA formyltransferase [Butyrivibrio sp. INlla21]|uniref:methionyl-tRNA formyltransferase n=1 Tax=Butyrivibrio sp. INlla21 TaxID=1520811 RepID=UPI0008E4270D|nr:formyltransferase family protein [Butyrivibrio sp. INlla21]SFU67147.1 UDP-4-amino-4-deoxy-L-arabinose formyltransferase / UDP-glucuronic acid dehydrogenase (UDP-4-keto-hexauronic acid decarboxylating) [Butyrivibrio sp. INlla21]
MHYKVVVFGVKDTSENIIDFIEKELCKVDLVMTIAPKVLEHNQVSGFKGLSFLTEKYGIPVYEAESYFLNDDKTVEFIKNNTFDLGIVMGWQRLIPPHVLDAFKAGIYGFHGNCGYLPFGRGRSPLNWSMILGDTRFNLNLFRYDEKADSPNVFATEMFQINEHDDIRTAQYKNMICSKSLIRKLVTTYMEKGEIPIHTDSKDFDSWYNKRTAADGKIDFHERTRNIYNLIRGVAAPFPGAFCYVGEESDENKVTVWQAHPFDEMIDFSGYAPGEIADVFDGKPIVRTVDGSLIIDKYDSAKELVTGMVLR